MKPMCSSSLSLPPPSLSLSGDHWATNANVLELIRHTPSSTTWRSKLNSPTVRFPANNVSLEELDPRIVTLARAPPPPPPSSPPPTGFHPVWYRSYEKNASWYKSYGIVGFLLIPTEKMCPAGVIFEFQRTTVHQQQNVL